MEWKRGPVIGRGSYATVYLASTAAGDRFAVKSTELSASGFLQKEQRFLSQLNSFHVISYMGFDVKYDDNKPMYNLFMEYAPGGTVSDVIKKHGGSLDESLIRSYTHQILLGLDHLHSNNLVHCDIKCENILVGEDGVKIGDLGCAKLVEDGGATTSAFAGTPVFMAPEVARGEEQGFAADVWALGCAVIEMATGCNPWPEVNDPVSALYRIGYSGDVPEFPRWLSSESKDFLDKCLKIEGKERWTTKQLFLHPFVNNLSRGFKKEEFTKDSPTSILDQDFWGPLEVPEPSPATTEAFQLSGESPVERIRQLSGATPPCIPNWAYEEDWVTVRSNHVEDNVKIIQQTHSMDSLDRIHLTRYEYESTQLELFLLSFSIFYVERMGGFNLVMLEDHVEEGHQSVIDWVVSRFLDLLQYHKNIIHRYYIIHKLVLLSANICRFSLVNCFVHYNRVEMLLTFIFWV